MQYALNTITRDTTNGDQINVKAGTSEILAAALSWTTYGTPDVSAPCVIRGYTSAANDGGIGVVSGNGSVACINSSSLQHIKLVDMRFTNSGANTIVTLSGSNTLALNCEVDGNTNASTGLLVAKAVNCFIHNIAGVGLQTSVLAYGNTLRNETVDFTIALQAGGGVVAFNLIDVDGATHGLNFNSTNIAALFNTIFSNGGTGVGLRNSTSGGSNLIIINNTVEGFSGVGGIGLQIVGQNVDVSGYNLLYNNATNVSATGDINVDLANNDVAGSSPFTNAGSDDFDPIAGLLASYPSYPTAWKSYASTQQNLIRMAAQYAAAAAAGGGPIFGGMVVR